MLVNVVTSNRTRLALCLVAAGLIAPAAAAQPALPQQSPPVTEHAQAMPEHYVRMTIWRVRNANLELVQAGELVRGAKPSPEPAAAQMAGRLSTVRLSASAIAEARALLQVDTLAQTIIRFDQLAAASKGPVTKVRPPGDEILRIPDDAPS